MGTQMTRCSAYHEWLSPYVDDQLEADRRRELEVHLTSCSHCSEELASLRQMLATLRSLDAPPAPDLLPGIRRKLAAAPWWRALAEQFTAPWPSSLPWHGLALAMTSLLVIVIVNTPRMRKASVLERSYDASPRVVAKDDVGGEKVGGTERAVTVANAPLAQTPAEESMRADQDYSKLKYGEQGGGGAFQQGIKIESISRAIARNSAVSSTEAPASPGLGGRMEDAAAPLPPRPSPTGRERSGAADELAEFIKSSPVIQGATAALELRWEVQDPTATAQRILEWVRANGGLAVATSETHLSIQLPTAILHAFLQAWGPAGSVFPQEVPEPVPAWITLSLDLVPTHP